MKMSKYIWLRGAALFLAVIFCVSAFPAVTAFADGNGESGATILTRKDFVYLDNKPFAEFANIEMPEVSAVHAIAVNLETGTVMYEKNADVIAFPASTVKLMTAIVAMENIPDLDVVIYASENAVKISSGTRINPTRPIKAGEGLTARQLLNALLINGANDAANVLAEHVGGSVEGFCAMMNEKAKELGAKNTVFKNPTGLHNPEMVTTAYDMAIIASHAYYNNELVKMSGSTNFTVEATNMTKERRYLYNRNQMIRRVEGGTDYFYKGTLGLSAGSTPEGGNCVVAVAERSGLTYLTVILGAQATDSENFAYRGTIDILDTLFEGFSVQKVASQGDLQCEIPVGLAANVDHITLHSAEDITALLPNDVDRDKDILLNNLVYEDAVAPVGEEQIFGELEVIYKGTIILGKTALVANTSVDRSNFLYVLDVLGKFFGSMWFITALISAAVLFTVYCILYYAANKRRKSRKGFRK